MSAVCSTCEGDLDETPEHGFYCASCTVDKLEKTLRQIIKETLRTGGGNNVVRRIATEALEDWPS